MRKSLIFLVVFNLMRVSLLMLISKSSDHLVKLKLLLSSNQHNIGIELISLASFSNPFFPHTGFAAIVLSTVMFVLLQFAFYVLLKSIVRNEKRYWVWIMLISSTMISPWLSLDFYEVGFLIIWLALIHGIYQAIFNGKPLNWFWSGIFIGLGFVLKAYILAIPIGILVFLIFSTKYRYFIYSIKPYLMLVVGATVAVPFVYGWIDLPTSVALNDAFYTSEVTGFYPSYFLNFLGGQFLILMPILFVGFWWMLFKYFGRIINKPNQVNPEFWFLLCFFIPMFLGIYVISFFYDTPVDLLLPVYLIGLVIFGKLMKKRWIYWHLTLNIIAYVALFALTIFSLI